MVYVVEHKKIVVDLQHIYYSKNLQIDLVYHFVVPSFVAVMSYVVADLLMELVSFEV